MNDLEKIETYLANLPADKRVVLENLRAGIKALVPEAKEYFSYGMPAFKLGKGLAAYAAGKNHFGYYPMSSNIIPLMESDLTGLKTSKGAVQFTFENQMTGALLEKLLLLRIAEIKRG